MIVVVSPRLAGPIAVALAALRKWYCAPDPEVRRELAELEARMRLAASDGQSRSPFDPSEMAAQAGVMKPLVTTLEEAARLLACSPKGVQRRIAAGDLEVIGTGTGTRVVVASIEAYVENAATHRKVNSP